MKKTSLLFILLLSVIAGWAQLRVPTIRVQNLEKEEQPVRISQLQIDVKVIGSLAVTTVDMTFFNPNLRVLEGELEFPLADGQSISRFALDINDKMREGVVVEKAKGQAAFESIVRRGVDPGLLEKTEGNNFRTRVYPLFANSTRRVIIAYEQELVPENGKYRVFLPVEYGDVLDKFDVKLAVHANDRQPQIDDTPWGNFSFSKAGEAYTASYSAKKYKPSGQIVFSVPVKDDIQLFVENGKIDKKTVFYTQILPEIKTTEKKMPQEIALFWDASLSMQNRNFKMESELLDKYFAKAGNLTVSLYTFNCKENKPQQFTIRNGNWDELKKTLQDMVYDGASQFGALNLPAVKADEILFFSDGLSNFGKIAPLVGTVPITTINSSLRADYSMLRYLSTTSGGVFVNLMQQDTDQAMKLLSDKSLRLISVDYDKNLITDLTTSGSTINPTQGLSIAGKLKRNSATLNLRFGVGNKVTHTEQIKIDAANAADYDNMVERLWAAKRIAELDMLYDENRRDIERIGKKYNIVTRNTSLIVLETVSDYIRYEITPPEELREEYNRIRSNQWKKQAENKDRLINDAVRLWERRKEWWDLRAPGRHTIQGSVKNEDGELLPTYIYIKNRPGKSTGSASTNGFFTIEALHNEVINFSSAGYHSQDLTVTRDEQIDIIMQEIETPGTKGVVSYRARGVIKNTNKEPLIGVVVSFKNEPTTGMVTDVDGRFSIRVPEGQILKFSYLGHEEQEITVVQDTTVEIILQENDDIFLDAVSITGAGSQKKVALTGAISTVNTEELKAARANNTNALAGSVSGILAKQTSSVPGQNTSEFWIRGISTFGKKSDALVLIDGVEGSLADLDIDNIASYSILRDASETAMYGARGANGVIVITTKEGAAKEGAASTPVNTSKGKSSTRIKSWEADAPYMTELKAKADNQLYDAYLSLRKDYESSLFFYLDVATLFEERGMKEEAFIILSNLAEMKLENYRVLRVLAHRLQQLGYIDYAIQLFEKVKELRPEEAQSFRDLGLAYAENKEYQKAIDTLYEIITKRWDNRFHEIQIFAVEEINNIVAKAGDKVDVSNIDSRLLFNMPVDIRIVLNWDTDNSDMDLWVTDPDNEKCYYRNPLTKTRGMITRDFTNGYGPEAFLIKDALKGKYIIEADYYGTREQTLIGPTTVYLDIYTYYGTPKETKKTIMLRLEKNEGEVEIGEIEF